MRYDSQTISEAQRRAYNTLAVPAEFKMVLEGQQATKKLFKNEFFVPKKQITSPAILIQEQQYVNSKQQFIFDFSINGALNSSTLNNRKLPQNNIAAIYGIQFLIGEGDAANNRVYSSTGFAVNDNSIYNSTFKLSIETDTVIDALEGQLFQDVQATPTMFDSTSGLQLINPIRILSGKMGVFQLSVNLNNSISALVLTPSLFLSARLHCVMGQATA